MFLMFFYAIFVGIFFYLGLWSMEEEKYFNAILNFALCGINIVLIREEFRIHYLKASIERRLKKHLKKGGGDVISNLDEED